MKYITVTNSQSLAFSTIETPIPAHDECLIKVRAIGVNRADILQRQGKYPAPKGESTILGLEACGEIIRCGDLVTDWLVGDNVFALVAGGAYAEYVVVKSKQLFALPKNFTYEQGAACAEVFLTAFQSLFTIASLKPYESVLIHAGASGVGTAAIQLAKANHCFVVTTVSKINKQQACLALGADVVINYQTTDFVAWSKEHHPQGFDVIVDVVGGDYVNKNINVAALDARIVILSMLGGRYAEQVDLAKTLSKRITLTASTLRNRSDDYKEKLIAAFKDHFSMALNQGDIRPVIDSVYDWQEVELAHQKIVNNDNIGKLILMVS